MVFRDIINFRHSLEGHSHEIGARSSRSTAGYWTYPSKHSCMLDLAFAFAVSGTSNEFINSRCINRDFDGGRRRETLLDAISVNCFFPLLPGRILHFIIASRVEKEKSCLIHFNIGCLERQPSNLRLIDGEPAIRFWFIVYLICGDVWHRRGEVSVVYFLGWFPWNIVLHSRQWKCVKELLCIFQIKSDMQNICNELIVIQHPRRYAPNSRHQLSLFFCRFRDSDENFSSCLVFFLRDIALKAFCSMKEKNFVAFEHQSAQRFSSSLCSAENLWAGKLKNIIAFRPGPENIEASSAHELHKNFYSNSRRDKRLPFSCWAPFSEGFLWL